MKTKIINKLKEIGINVSFHDSQEDSISFLSEDGKTYYNVLVELGDSDKAIDTYVSRIKTAMGLN